MTYHTQEFSIRYREFNNFIIKKACNINNVVGTYGHPLWTVKVTLITKGTYKPTKVTKIQGMSAEYSICLS